MAFLLLSVDHCLLLNMERDGSNTVSVLTGSSPFIEYAKHCEFESSTGMEGANTNSASYSDSFSVINTYSVYGILSAVASSVWFQYLIPGIFVCKSATVIFRSMTAVADGHIM